MALQQVDIPGPDELRPRWAAFAAVCAARGWRTMAWARPDRWHYDDAGGNWVELIWLTDGEVLIGNDHEYSETYFREAAEYFEEDETDLLAEAPDWWEQALEGREPEDWVGFVYGRVDGAWWRADYEADDGFASVGLPASSDERTREMIAEFSSDAPGLGGRAPDAAAVDVLMVAGPEVTEEQLAAVVPGWDVGAGVAAARAFAAR
jgi:hypothetical protein